MPLESTSAGTEDNKFDNEKNLWCGLEKSGLTRPLQPAPHLCLRLAARGYISHYQYNAAKSQTDSDGVALWVKYIG